MSRPMDIETPAPVVAVLGPTNTGKTHLAVERLLAHRSGMIGLPLRLLAREVFDRVAGRIGGEQVALVTGEERLVPRSPRFWVCTVEAMPISVPVEFLAVDEIQLAADPERGHTFTDRLISARGTQETMFLGSDTIRPLLKRLIPGVRIEGRPRLSRLSFAGHHKLSRLPRRSAVIAYRAEDVYAIAEVLRRQKGGAAVVMGALSPRTRNAQVAMFEAGEVDYLVATDAVGMGLNLGIDHVAFAARHKFDGRIERRLTSAEIAQVAGRAGRHLNDGTFGTTGEAKPFEDDLVSAVESHGFPALTQIRYRNADLDFSSVPGLITSLEAPPRKSFLRPAHEASDIQTLRSLYREPDIAQAARSPANVSLLWQVCTIPDFQQMLHETHTNLLGQLFRHLAGATRRLPHDLLARNIEHLDRTSGDIDTLQMRLAHIRTWTYIAHQRDWVEAPRHWQERAIAVEDRLSDALHARLTQRFVDKHHVATLRRLRESGTLAVQVEEDDAVSVDGAIVGKMRGLKFSPSINLPASDRKAIRRELRSEVERRASAVLSSDDDFFEIKAGTIEWQGASIARLARGELVRRPLVDLIDDDATLDARYRSLLQSRVTRWLDKHISTVLAPLIQLDRMEFKGACRGLAYQLVENFGVTRATDVANLLKDLLPNERQQLRRLGVTFGRYFVYLATMLKQKRAVLALELHCVFHGRPILDLPVGRVSFEVPRDIDHDLFKACGFWRIGGRAVRVDALERLDQALAGVGPTVRETPQLLSLIGFPRSEFSLAMEFLGYRQSDQTKGLFSIAASRPVSHKNRRQKIPKVAATASPFAVLRELYPVQPGPQPSKGNGRGATQS
ncbi:MAG: helicase-related protein [Alphaproteobacteria bacterium]